MTFFLFNKFAWGSKWGGHDRGYNDDCDTGGSYHHGGHEEGGHGLIGGLVGGIVHAKLSLVGGLLGGLFGHGGHGQEEEYSEHHSGGHGNGGYGNEHGGWEDFGRGEEDCGGVSMYEEPEEEDAGNDCGFSFHFEFCGH